MFLKIKSPVQREYVVVHQKKIHVGDYIEIFNQLWEGVYRVDQIQSSPYLPCRFKNKQGHNCWPSPKGFRKFDRHETE